MDVVDSNLTPIDYYIYNGYGEQMIGEILQMVYEDEIVKYQGEIVNEFHSILNTTIIELIDSDGTLFNTTVNMPFDTTNGEISVDIEGGQYDTTLIYSKDYRSIWRWNGSAHKKTSIFDNYRLNQELFFNPSGLSPENIQQNLDIGKLPLGSFKYKNVIS